jgi:DNA primase
VSSDPIVERVREAADIVQIIGEHVKLKRAGGDFRGPCPFHGGKNPNFSVSPKRQSYHCFKCGESGDVFSFMQKHLGMSFPDALRSVASTVGIEIPQFQRTERAGPDPREPFWEMNAIAADWFQRVLWTEERAAGARAYLEKRGLSRADAERFQLGYAPDDLAAFRAHMGTMGFDVPRLVEGGLLVQREDQSEPRQRFRNRLMFPITDANMRHVAFGGRALGDVEPKYLNSPETPVFSKSRTLYALGWCKNAIRKADRVFVVEGYMDAIRLMVAGLDTVVAPLGTALTQEQAEMLTRYTKSVYLLYDSDQAGLKATFRAGDELLRHGAAVRVVTLPEGEDPDTFVRANGAAALEQHVAQSVDVFERKIQILERSGWFAELQKKRRALDRLLPTIRAASDPLLRELYVGRAAEKTGVAKDVLLREVAGRDRRPPAAEEPPIEEPARHVEVRRRDRRHDRARQGEAAERELVRAMLADPHRTPAIAEKADPARFSDPHYRAIFEAMLALEDEYTVERLAERLHEDDIPVLNSLLDELDAQNDPDKTITASLAALAMRDIDARLAEIDSLISIASAEELTAFIKEKQRLQKEIELLGQSPAKSFKFLKRRFPAPSE